jgi:hypothetical protein
MKILKSQINNNDTLPEIRECKGHINCVLAIRSNTQYESTNTYIPKWDVVNAVYYNIHKDKFEGWIDLEDQLPPKEIL